MVGNSNSGRRGGKPVIERSAAIPIDVEPLARAAAAAGGASAAFVIHGAVADRPFTVDVEVKIAPDRTRGRLTLSTAGFQHLTCPVLAHETVFTLEAVPNALGGLRWYVRCCETNRRCRRLFLPDGATEFRSRAGHGLVSLSERTTIEARARARISRLHARLGSDPESEFPMYHRPRGMHIRSFRRILENLAAADGILAAQFIRVGRRAVLANGVALANGRSPDRRAANG